MGFLECGLIAQTSLNPEGIGMSVSGHCVQLPQLPHNTAFQAPLASQPAKGTTLEALAAGFHLAPQALLKVLPCNLLRKRAFYDLQSLRWGRLCWVRLVQDVGATDAPALKGLGKSSRMTTSKSDH